jgi:hypothetical protein
LRGEEGRKEEGREANEIELFSFSLEKGGGKQHLLHND